MKIFTLGYQGLAPETYIQALINAGVKIVLDVRENAWSQRPAYVGGTLRRSLDAVGIGYEHWKILGNPMSNRRQSTTPAQCMRRYRLHLNQRREALDLLANRLRSAASKEEMVCLTCYENEAINCHRNIIVEALEGIETALVPIHLEPDIVRRTVKQAKTSNLIQTAFLSPSFLPFT